MKENKLAFTMAEILLSLTIIGVVAAITLPSLTGNINERTWNTQRKALYARFSQALALMPSLNGYGTLTAEQTDSDGNVTQSAVDTAAETFVTDGLSKVLKINNICDNEHLHDCGIPSKILPLDGGSALIVDEKATLKTFNPIFADDRKFKKLDTKAVAFETVNGESILAYYNPTCSDSILNTSIYAFNYDYSHNRVCVNFVYDLNGSKGPNTVGKDIGFITAIKPVDAIVVAPMPYSKDAARASYSSAGKSCTNFDAESRIPSINEYISIYFNRDIVGQLSSDYWAGDGLIDSQYAYAFAAGYGMNYTGNVYSTLRSNQLPIRCIKR